MKKLASLVIAGLVLSATATATTYTLSNGNFGSQTAAISFVDGDIIDIPAAAKVSFTGTQTINKAITLDIHGELKMTPGNKILTLGNGSLVNVYNGGELSGASAAQQLVIGTNNVFNGASTVSSTGSTMTATASSIGFSSMATPLAIKLISFDAKAVNNTIVLNWSAVNDRDEAASFSVEQSTDGKNWEVVATEAARGAAHQTVSYTKELAAPQGTKTAIYRIAFEGDNGKRTYSATRTLTIATRTEVSATITAAAGQINISLQGQNENTQVFVSTMDGKLIAAQRYSEALSISTPNSGMYLITITDNSSFKNAQKVVMP